MPPKSLRKQARERTAREEAAQQEAAREAAAQQEAQTLETHPAQTLETYPAQTLETQLTESIQKFQDELQQIRNETVDQGIINAIRQDQYYNKYEFLQSLIPATSGGRKIGGRKIGSKSIIKTIPKKTRKKIRKIYKGPRGGTYYKSKGKKIYIK